MLDHSQILSPFLFNSVCGGFYLQAPFYILWPSFFVCVRVCVNGVFINTSRFYQLFLFCVCVCVCVCVSRVNSFFVFIVFDF